MTKAVTKTRKVNRSKKELEAELEAKDLDIRRKSFVDGVNKLQQEYMVQIEVVMNNTVRGNFPTLTLADTKGKEAVDVQGAPSA